MQVNEHRVSDLSLKDRQTSVLTLRDVGSDDEAFLYSVYASTRADELAVVPWTPEQKEAFLRMQFAAQHASYHDRTAYPNPGFHIIELDSRPIGRLYVHRSAGEILIVDIALLPPWRGKGIGTRLLTDLVREADETGAVLRLHVEPWNPAMHLYERLGFRRSGEQGIYFAMERPPRVGGHG